MPKLILTSVGTLGDLHPLIAIGLALKDLGCAPVLAVAGDQVASARAEGLEAEAIFPSFDAVRAGMGLSDEEAIRRLMSDQREFLERMLLPALSSSAMALDELAADAKAIISTPFVFAAPIIAEKRGIPLINIVLQPMAMLSSYDPPATPDFWMARQAPVGRIGAAWNNLIYAVMRRALQHLYSEKLDAVHAEQGVRLSGAADMLEPQKKAALVVGCYSKTLAPIPVDAPAKTKIVGFPFYDRQEGRGGALDPQIAAFLDGGAPPVMFTLGTFAVRSAGNFYEDAEAIARSLRVRAVLLVGGTAGVECDGPILRCGYVPHSLLFPLAALIVHHGGVGTTGQAMRAGKPQLVIPHMGDQSDHAHRIERLGLGLWLKASRFTVARGTPKIRQLLGTPSFQEQARDVAAVLNAEDGAENAARAIIDAISARRLDGPAS
jgi:rhamnosyltransferase subunit B